jgi:hypothetical protein
MSSILTSANTLLRRQPFGAAVGFLFLAMTLPTLIGLALDSRTITGVSVWLKPFKFQLSLAVHVLTVTLALGTLDSSVSKGWAAGAAFLGLLAMSLFEVGWITWQGARGLPSHFAADPFDMAVYALMGVGATLIVLSTALLGMLVLRHPAHGVPRLVSRAVGIGFIISGATGLVTGWAIAMNGGRRGGRRRRCWPRHSTLRLVRHRGRPAGRALSRPPCGTMPPAAGADPERMETAKRVLGPPGHCAAVVGRHPGTFYPGPCGQAFHSACLARPSRNDPAQNGEGMEHGSAVLAASTNSGYWGGVTGELPVMRLGTHRSRAALGRHAGTRLGGDSGAAKARSWESSAKDLRRALDRPP